MNESTTFIPSHNRIVYDRILQLVASKETKNYEEKVHEFDGCNYLMQSSKEGTWRLSFARPAPQDGAEEEDDQVARDAVSEAFQNVAAVRPEPEDGYDVTIDLEVSFLRRLDFEQQAFWAKTLASIRLLWTGAALRQHFQALRDGVAFDAPPRALSNTAGETFYVKMTKDSVAIVLPMWFTGGQDTAIGTAFLQELATARQSSALRMSPACSHHAGDRPPPELRGVKLLPRRSSCASVTAGGGGASSARSSRASDDAARPPPLTAAQLLQPNGGYVTFTFQPRHVSGPQIDAIVWSMLSFSYFVSFQIAASKVMLHSRLRSELTAMVDRLNESKMASSYTIRQQLGSPATSPPGTSPSTSSFSAAAVAAAAPVTAVLAPERSVASVASAAVSGSANLVAMAEFTGLTLEERMASMTGAEMAAAATVGAAAPPLRPANASSTGASRATAAITEQQQAAAPYVAAPEAVILTSAAEVVPRPATPTHPPSAGGGGHEAGPASAGRSGPKSILQHYRNFSARFSPAKSPAAAAGSSGSSPLNSTPGKSPKSGGKDRTSRRLEPRFGCF